MILDLMLWLVFGFGIVFLLFLVERVTRDDG